MSLLDFADKHPWMVSILFVVMCLCIEDCITHIASAFSPYLDDEEGDQ